MIFFAILLVLGIAIIYQISMTRKAVIDPAREAQRQANNYGMFKFLLLIGAVILIVSSITQ
jgi:putative copper export protein